MRHKRTDRDLIIRRLFEVDQEDIGNHFRRLDTDSRRARFCGSVSNTGITRYVRTIFRFESQVIGAFVEGRLQGVAELRGVLNFWPPKAEAAISVDPDWQNLGIGDALVERVITMAQNRCVGSIRLMCLKENTRMRHLATKHGAQICFDRDVIEAILHTKSPIPTNLTSAEGTLDRTSKWLTRISGR